MCNFHLKLGVEKEKKEREKDAKLVTEVENSVSISFSFSFPLHPRPRRNSKHTRSCYLFSIIELDMAPPIKKKKKKGRMKNQVTQGVEKQ